MSTIDQIKERLDAVAVISEAVPLTKAGRLYRACCPFHTEKTPSFYVYPDRQSWHCFGACATGGDIFSFVMKQQGIDFRGALQQLASKAGVELVEVVRNPAEQERSNRLLEANQEAALFYHQLLLTSSESGAGGAREYVLRRGISTDMRSAFMLGYSPSKRDSLKHHLNERGYTDDELQEAGLIVEGQNGLADRFWNRLMFPIWNASGALVGFGARTLTDAQPKYLNSPQTPLFDKGNILYAMNRSQDGIRKERKVVIVEGYMDALMAHQYGFNNVVASMGTALTEAQVQLISRYTTSIILALDADAAGQTAMLRSLETVPAAMGVESVPVPEWKGKVRFRQKDGRAVIGALPQGTISIVSRHKGDIRILELPNAKDPDELIRNDAKAWPDLVEKAIPMMDFLIKAVAKRVDLTTPRGKAQAAEDILPFIAELPSVVEQGHYLQQLSGMVGVDERTLRGALPQKKVRQAAPTRQEAQLQDHLDRTQALEDYCLALLLRNGFLREEGSTELRADHFLSTEAKALFTDWQAHPGDNLSDVVDSSLLPRLELINELLLPPAGETQTRAALGQCIRRLEERRLRELKLQQQMRFTPPDTDNLVDIPIVNDLGEAEVGADDELQVNRDLQQLMLENMLKRKKIS